jgi:four helix bundle protein
MTNNQNNKIFDLEDRTLEFAKKCLDLCKLLQNFPENIEYKRQLIRSSGSVGANYREANEAISKKDFLLRLRICRKESKESKYWLELLLYGNKNLEKIITPLINESLELVKIFNSIINKNKQN